ncbi:FCD domain-containing protein [Epibacterium sp. Ofav1-8]|jgi:GntR family uxuAB operon transcriptional repressor|uniref:FCD domain-containing protein n=1 Tax=Epibacterium sp. Ofav1-8 TaxID=2917735 RepID=UPI001EF4B64A|nr:FCD domain-containing protein [Epibacterium sp. Ofav1-8]MCG7622254.1 FCD domain-containing protein [Epibacterium sp. Ofav1-8]
MSQYRRYQDVAQALRVVIRDEGFAVGDRLPPERQLSERLSVSRSLVREALIMLEIDGLVEVRKGSGIYLAAPSATTAPPVRDDIGPFELLQARQLLESSIAAFAAEMVTKNDITRMREALEMERQQIESGSADHSGDELFHRLIAEATQNSVLVDMVDELWRKREQSPMWAKLHDRIFDADYRRNWLEDHQKILAALRTKDRDGARAAMWQHLAHVRETLMELSDVDDPAFDGYLFQPISAPG